MVSRRSQGACSEALQAPSYLTAREPFGRAVAVRTGDVGVGAAAVAQALGEPVCGGRAASRVRASLVITQQKPRFN